MSVSALLLTLDPDPACQAQARARLRALPGLTLGPQYGVRLAAVLETPSLHDDRSAFDHLAQLPGVTHLALVGAWFDHDLDPDALAASCGRTG